MPGRSRSRSRGVRSVLSVLALALAAVCMALLLGLGAAGSAAASAGEAAYPLTSPTPTNTPTTPTNTPGQAPTATPTLSGTTTPTTTATVTVTATTTKTATATATATSDSSGGGTGGLGGDTGPQPTKVVFTQPNGGNGGGGPLGGLSPSTIGSSGLLFAATGSCIVALLGLIVAAIALMVLVQGGYGPYLRALLRGKRAGRGSEKGDLSAQLAGSEWDAGYAGNADYRASSPQGGAGPRRHPYDDGYGSNVQAGYEPRRDAPARSQPVRRSPPSSRSRPDWR
jgi:hypothetical protein